MQLLEDYSEPQPSVFYQTPQNEHIYQQKNKLLMEVYGFNDSFSTEAPHELAPPPALPPKQRQLVSRPPPHPVAGTLRFRRPGAGLPWATLLPTRVLSLPPDKLPHLPPWGWRRLSLPEQPRAAGPGWYSECLLSLLTVSCIFSSLLWLQYRPPRKGGLNQGTGPGLCTAICGLDLHNGPTTQSD